MIGDQYSFLSCWSGFHVFPCPGEGLWDSNMGFTQTVPTSMPMATVWQYYIPPKEFQDSSHRWNNVAHVLELTSWLHTVWASKPGHGTIDTPSFQQLLTIICTSFIVSQHKTQLRAFLWGEDLWAPLWLRRRSCPGQDFAQRLFAAITSSWTRMTGPSLALMEALISLKCTVQQKYESLVSFKFFWQPHFSRCNYFNIFDPINKKYSHLNMPSMFQKLAMFCHTFSPQTKC